MLEPLYKAMGDQLFDLDPCSPTKGPDAPVWAKKHFTKDDDGLSQKWHGRIWLNPPYASLSEWVRTAAPAHIPVQSTLAVEPLGVAPTGMYGTFYACDNRTLMRA